MKHIFARINIPNLVVGAAALFCAGSLLMISSNMAFGGLPAFIYGLLGPIILIGGYLGWKGWIGRAHLPKSGMELPLLACTIGVLVSLALSPNPRAGLQRVAELIILFVVFTILTEVFTAAQARSMARLAFLWVSGFLSLSALVETYAWYLGWWGSVGSRSIMPPFPYRFLSLAMHSSWYMLIANMCAPIAIISLIKTQSRAARFGLVFWLVTYMAAIPFSSSRAGWLGAAVWVFAIAVLWLREAENRALLREYMRRIHRNVLIAGTSFTVISFAFALLVFYQMFAAGHPTHGSSTSLNREWIWDSAIVVVQSSPWVGTGPGQTVNKLLPASQASPFGFWPVHAHSTPLQILTEFGVVGFIPFLFLLLFGIIQAKRALGAVPAVERLWIWASISALAAAMVQGIFDDVTYTLFPLGLTVYHTASILYRKMPEQRYPQISLLWLAVPSLFAFCVTTMNIWACLPYHQAFHLAKRGEWAAAAHALDQSVQRDPTQPGYRNQAGMAWASVWRETSDPQALTAARNHLAQNLVLDPGYSLVWANLAVLDWHSGQRDQALLHIRKAIDLSPGEATYWLNYGFFLEQMGQTNEAVQYYRKVLDQSPRGYTHPFWRSSPLRERVLNETLENFTEEGEFPYWMLARSAVEENDYAAARQNISLSMVNLELPVAATVARVELARREGTEAEVRGWLETVRASAEANYWGNNYYLFQFIFYCFPNGVVPGYMKINADGGQFAALEELVQLQIKDRDCQAAEHTWIILQRELRAGELPEQGYPPAPVCP